MTDISQYDTGDTSGLVWFTVPKATGEPIWLPPYITENLGVRVISYNVPIFSKEQFTGVVGIEVDYSTMAEEVDNIRLFDNGYAFIINEEGSIIYHPLIDVTAMSEEEKPRMPVELPEQNSSFTYTFEGVEKTAVWRPLQNGMRLVVSVPTSEISGSWQNLIRQILGASVILLILFVILTMRFTGSITKPLRDLTDVAVKMNRGNYDVSLDYRGDDEVGILTEAFNRLVNYLKAYIRDLNNLAYSDALTSVKSKGAYDIYGGNLQNRIQESPEEVKFAIAVFDCDNLKEINDVYGHEKGDVYLKNSSHMICHVFQHSPVFRTGGDEFTVILQNDDYEHRKELMRLFEERSRESIAQADQPWKKVSVSAGIAEYEPKSDSGVNDVARRADQKMYEHKRIRKMIRE